MSETMNGNMVSGECLGRTACFAEEGKHGEVLRVGYFVRKVVERKAIESSIVPFVSTNTFNSVVSWPDLTKSPFFTASSINTQF